MTTPYSPVTFGKSRNFFTKFTVNNSDFPSLADVVFNVKGVYAFSFVNEGSAVVEYSFEDGETVHGDMTPSSPTAAIFFDNRRVSKIFFRTGTPGQVVRIEAWAV